MHEALTSYSDARNGLVIDSACRHWSCATHQAVDEQAFTIVRRPMKHTKYRIPVDL